MQIHIIAIGKKMPGWIQSGFLEYKNRMPTDYRMNLIEITAEKRLKQANLKTICAMEESKINTSIPPRSTTIVLDRVGSMLDTKSLAKHLQTWHDIQQDVSFVIGGPEGLSTDFLTSAKTIWSLSALTLPHPLVRVLLAEQLYRAWSMIVKHPYHR
ncbi:MAG: hypothetical protein ACD_29C00126G0001 [uncultured bacterium]|nr:MAG: hypothetical protein ACD_29C00126G0001 [uncultured bacterium]